MKAWIRVVDAAGRPTPMLTVEGSYPGSADEPSVDFTAMTGWSIGFDESRPVSLRIVPAVRGAVARGDTDVPGIVSRLERQLPRRP